MNDLCHICGGNGKDSISLASASYNDKCSNCNGTGLEPMEDAEENNVIEYLD
ncbi:MAG: hypothetical protein Q8934_11650 [Bacillota bacterium]|nr:hypothetical protein [Bacillota bacterium]